MRAMPLPSSANICQQRLEALISAVMAELVRSLFIAEKEAEAHGTVAAPSALICGEDVLG